MTPYNPLNWYWTVANGPADYVYASAVGDYVRTSNANYAAWLEAGGVPTQIDTEENLGTVLGQAEAKIPVPPVMQEAYKASLIDAVDPASTTALLDHENRIRALEGAPPLTLAQFKAHVKTLL